VFTDDSGVRRKSIATMGENKRSDSRMEKTLDSLLKEEPSFEIDIVPEDD
jgi:hypothetical protein